MKIGYEHIYDSYRELVINSENISWGRFQNLLTINSILVVAWATLFAADAHFWARLVMTAITIPGILAGIAWAYLGKRSRQYLDLYKAKLQAIEEHHDKKDWWEDGISITDRPFQVKVTTCRFSSSTFLLFWTPLLFSLMNLVLLLATWLN
jgi:hypothetical protein